MFMLACTFAATAARAEPAHVIRLATPAPDGTAWARELKAFARDVEGATHGAVRIKWYLGGIAGDDVAAGERIQRKQLDGVGSGGVLCQRFSASMRALRLLGLFESRDEYAFALGRLKPILDDEFRQAGFVNLAEGTVGPNVLFTRSPVRRLAELRQGHYWLWDLDELLPTQLGALDVHLLVLPLETAGRAYDERRVDGFIAPPGAALAFQWSTQASYLADLRVAWLTGCLLIANRVFDGLPPEAQRAVVEAGARFHARWEQEGGAQDEALLGGLFARQGLKAVPVSAAFRAEFFAAARAVRERYGPLLVPRPVIDRVVGILTEYRAAHPEKK
jgi:TRAP-type C4-dicarboxylate transport system substrate-binding protein